MYKKCSTRVGECDFDSSLRKWDQYSRATVIPTGAGGVFDMRATQFGGPSFQFLFDWTALPRGGWILILQAGGVPTGTGGRT